MALLMRGNNPGGYKAFPGPFVPSAATQVPNRIDDIIVDINMAFVVVVERAQVNVGVGRWTLEANTRGDRRRG